MSSDRPQLRLERYVRGQVPIAASPWLDPWRAQVLGVIELGLHYDAGQRPSAYRVKLIELGEVAARRCLRQLDEDTADAITADLDARIVALWGDRPRFIEVWRGFGDDSEPLTQLYAPHGMPRFR